MSIEILIPYKKIFIYCITFHVLLNHGFHEIIYWITFYFFINYDIDRYTECINVDF